jgi:GTP-sensing pleiotropic transcriptional regulator CodY
VKQTVSVEEWRAALEAAEVHEPVPEGWLTRDQVGELLGVRKSSTSEKLRNMIAAGLVESRSFCVKITNGNWCSLPHYRLAKKK